MPFLLLQVVVTFALDLVHALARSQRDRLLEVVLLRQQLRLYERKATQRPRPSRWETVILAAVASKLPDLSRAALVFTPATPLPWHREIVRRTWTFYNAPKPGRPVVRTNVIRRVPPALPGCGCLACAAGRLPAYSLTGGKGLGGRHSRKAGVWPPSHSGQRAESR